MGAVKDGKKTCRRCEWLLPVSEFHEHPNGGYQAWCRLCQSAYQKNVRAVGRQLKDPNTVKIIVPSGLSGQEVAHFVSDVRRILKDPTWTP